MTAAQYAKVLQDALPGWTVQADPDTRGVLRLHSPAGLLGLVRPSTGAVGHELQPGFRTWTWPRPEYRGARGARRLAAELLAANPPPAPAEPTP